MLFCSVHASVFEVRYRPWGYDHAELVNKELETAPPPDTKTKSVEQHPLNKHMDINRFIQPATCLPL